ncbi:hypothetical protein K491DRAFT_549848, partial [Lophiostoma macrostomum CBS 122681]
LATLAFALTASVSAQFDNQSAPFHLVLISDDSSVDGDTLSACHAGAGIESLCLSHSISTSKTAAIAATPFQFNTSDSVVTPNKTLGAPGYLTYELQGSNFNESEALGLYIDRSTNVGLLLLEPGTQDAIVVAFDSNNLLNIQDYIDDTQDPPVAGNYTAYYRWYSCTTYYVGYQYVTLTWVLGEAKPQNPTCVKVDVKRVF